MKTCINTRLQFFLSVLLILIFSGCTPQSKNKVLRFMFDGVPPYETPTPVNADMLQSPTPGAQQTIIKPPEFYSHEPYRARECNSCHEVERANIPDGTPQLCFQCHDTKLTSGALVHGALDEGCVFCHHPHRSRFEYQLNKGLPELCFECHDEESINEVEQHGLMGNNKCTACHNPHSSDNPVLLYTIEKDKGCFLCHEASDIISPEKLTHDPAKEGSCFLCHTSHSEGGDSHIAREGKDLCGECHEVPEEGTRFIHGPLEDGECTVCHNPHGSDISSNLVKKLPELCFECHDEDLMAGSTKHMPAEEGECAVCHSPHGGSIATLLTGPVPELCGNCHEGENEHVNEMLAEKSLCTECHNPHSSNEGKLIRE